MASRLLSLSQHPFLVLLARDRKGLHCVFPPYSPYNNLSHFSHHFNFQEQPSEVLWLFFLYTAHAEVCSSIATPPSIRLRSLSARQWLCPHAHLISSLTIVCKLIKYLGSHGRRLTRDSRQAEIWIANLSGRGLSNERLAIPSPPTVNSIFTWSYVISSYLRVHGPPPHNSCFTQTRLQHFHPIFFTFPK